MTCIIVLNYNGWQDTIVCLKSLLNIESCDYEIIIIDNNSKDNSMAYLTRWLDQEFHNYTSDIGQLDNSDSSSTYKNYSFYQAPYVYNPLLKKVSIYRCKENRGYSAGNNIGIRYALANKSNDFIWILNNDTIVSSDALVKMIEVFNKAKLDNVKLGIVGLKLLYFDDPTIVQCLGGGTYNAYTGVVHQVGNGNKDSSDSNALLKKAVSYISGASMLVTKEFIKDVGLLNEDYFLYFEELDWATRGKIRGWNIDYTIDSFVLHKEGSSISKGKDSKSKLADYCFLRSKILYTKHYESWFCKSSLYITVPLSLIIRLFRGQFDRVPIMLKILLNPKPKEFLFKI